MKTLPRALVGLTALSLVTSASLFAAKGTDPKQSKTALMEKYDLNKNGKLDAEELAQLKSDFMANPRGELKRFDTDHDGKLSDGELAAIGGKKGAKADKADKAETDPFVKKKKKAI